MASPEEIRSQAQQVAQRCIEDWARESWYEINEVFGTDFTEDEMLAISDLAATALAVLPPENTEA